MEQIKKRSSGELFAGLIIMGVGVLFLLRNIDLIEFPFHKLWPLIFLVIGIARLFSASNWESRSDSIFWFFMSAAFFIGSNHIWGFSNHETWPLILIGVGLGVLAKSVARQFRSRLSEEQHNG